MNVYWLEQTDADMPVANDWLSGREATSLSRLRFAKRRSDWRLGRWTAKQAVALLLNMPARRDALAGIEIRQASSGAPEVFFASQPSPVTISLSHREGAAVCAVAPSSIALGCDLEVIEPRSDTFVTDYFTPEEQALVARRPASERLRLLALLWSGKESALKALHAGLGLDTRSVIVDLVNPAIGSPGWCPFRVRSTSGKIFYGWWQSSDPVVRTLVAAPPPAPPIALKNLSAMSAHA